MSRRLPVVAAALLALAVAAPASAGVPAATTGPAFSIDARSAIVGGSVNPGGEIRDFLVPVPEPTTLALFGVGIGIASARRNRRNRRKD